MQRNDFYGHVLARFAADRDRAVVVRQTSYLPDGTNIWLSSGWAVILEQDDAAPVIKTHFPPGPAHAALNEAESWASGLRFDARVMGDK
jgi:hypothetical protein